jgi:hypothetical protein
MKIEKLILHHSASPMLTTTHEDVVRWHLERGFKEIGYHGTIDYNGLFVAGRNELKHGAHNLHGGWNRKSLGYCILGNFEHEFLTEQAIETTSKILARRVLIHKLSVLDIIGHNDTGASTLCPGKNFPLKEIRKRVSSLLNFTL